MITRVFGRGGHLEKLASQLEARKKDGHPGRIGLVVTCLTPDELDGFKIATGTFASEADWRKTLRVPLFKYIRMEDTYAPRDYDEVLDVVKHIAACRRRE